MKVVADTEDGNGPDGDRDPSTTAEYIRSLRLAAGLELSEVARRAGVAEEWLERFEAGLIREGLNYDQLLGLIRVTQPPRPDWWDSGHEHDLNLPPTAIRNKSRNAEYWNEIEQVRALNRGSRGA